MTGVQVRIAEDWQRGGIALMWMRRTEQGTTVWNPGTGIQQYVEHGYPATALEPVEPLHLSDDDARALLAALIRHYDGGEDTRSLRRDYDAERKRVDLLISALLPVSGSTRGEARE